MMFLDSLFKKTKEDNIKEVENTKEPKLKYERKDNLDPLPYMEEWPSLRCFTGRVDIHSLAAFWVNQSKIFGPYLEFGVASGRSAISAIRASKLYGDPVPKDFFLFDSFEGLPELTGKDQNSNQFNKGDFSFSEQEVINNLQLHEVYDKDKIHLIKGYFEKSLDGFNLEKYGYNKVSIVHIDVDLFESCTVVLDFITPYLQQGTIILFDDWNCFNASNKKGERAATNEWISKNPNISLNNYAFYGWHGQAFIVDM